MHGSVFCFGYLTTEEVHNTSISCTSCNCKGTKKKGGQSTRSDLPHLHSSEFAKPLYYQEQLVKLGGDQKEPSVFLLVVLSFGCSTSKTIICLFTKNQDFETTKLQSVKGSTIFFGIRGS